MRFIRSIWKLFIMASVFGIGYIIGREHSFEEEEMWEDEEFENDTEDEVDGKDEADVKKNINSNSADIEVTFEVEDAEAEKVSLVGEFNDWNKDTNPMTKEDGIWKCTLTLKSGKHEYQFVIDDTDWVVDPKADSNVNNKYEGKNSVIEVK